MVWKYIAFKQVASFGKSIKKQLGKFQFIMHVFSWTFSSEKNKVA